MKKGWIIIIIAGAFILITLVIALIIHISFYKNICPDNVCQTPECVKISAQILNSIDSDVDPCDNFYKFVCGNFIKDSEVSDDEGEVSASSLVNDVIKSRLKDVLEEPIQSNDSKPFTLTKDYYQVCMDTDAIEQLELDPLHDLLSKIGGWPVLENSSWDGKHLDWFYYIYKLRHKGLDANYILKLNIDHDLKNTTFHMLELDQPILSLPESYFTEEDENKDLIEEYRKYMVNVAVYLGAKEYDAVTQLNEALNFEIGLARILEEKYVRSNVTKIYNIMTIQDLEIEHSTIPWLEYVNNIISPYAEVTSQERILILTPDYVRKLESLLQQTPKRAQINYIVWKAIDSIIPYLNEDLRTLQLKFKMTLTGVSADKPRWKECVDEVYKRFPIALSIQYMNVFPVDDVEERISEILQNIKMEYVKTIEATELIQNKLKKGSVHKLLKMNDIIGFSSDILNDRKLEELYEEVEIQPKQFLHSFLTISLLYENFQYKHLRVLKTRTAWLEQSLGVQDGIFYNAFINTLTIAAGVTEKNYFDNHHPNFINYGGIGFEISREIALAFFETGKDFDEKGEYLKPHKKIIKKIQKKKKKHEIDEEEEEEEEDDFTLKENCIIEQSEAFQIEELDNKTINSLLTLENNIADNFGVKHAYDAYVEWAQNHGNEKMLPGLRYTPVQLFWISFALNRCSKMTPESYYMSLSVKRLAPSEYRVIGSVMNIEDFGKDFECPNNSEMNPENKCDFW